MERQTVTILAVTLNTATSTTEEIRLGSYSGGFVYLPTTEAASVTSLTWYVAEKPGGTYHPAYDEDGVAVTQTVAHTRAYAIPSSLFGAAAIKAVSNAAGTVSVSLKS